MNFKKFTENDLELLNTYLKNTDYVGSDFSYYGYLIWFDTEYAIKDNFLFIRAFFGDKLRYWPPLCFDKKDLKKAMGYLPKDATYTSFLKEDAEQFIDQFDISTKREWSEYIYKASDFINQIGSKYSAKRNHITKFKTLYNYTIDSFKEEDLDAIAAFEKSWLESRVFETEYQRISAIEESSVIIKEIEASLKGNTICDVLKVDGKLVGFTVGEIMASGNAIVSVEKADTSYEGIYSFLSHEFALRHFSNCNYINRQEDMGIEGLRKSKLSYNPAFLLDKYVLYQKGSLEYIPKPCFDDDPFFNNSVGIGNLNEDNDNKLSIQDQIKMATYNDYVFKELTVDDYNSAMSFFKCGISRLDDKKFFLNYTDEELTELLHHGHMFGLFYDNHLIATCAVDLDKEYGNYLADICSDHSKRQFYEFSGIMVCPYHRKKGLAKYICTKVIEFSKENLAPATLCAVVQFNNEPSLNNLKSLGFREVAEQSLGDYRFKYLTLNV